MSQIELAKKLDQLAVQSTALRQKSPELSSILDLVKETIDGLQTENTRLLNQLTITKHGLISALETASA